MLIRKNTKSFKTILEIVTACQTRSDREKLIRLYITRAGHTLEERISVEGIQGDAAVFYEMNYQAVLTYLQSSNHQLHLSDEVPGIYFFRSTSNKVWDEMPFEFDEAVKKEFSSLPELPAVRKKEKVEKYVIPTADVKKTGKDKKKDVKKPELKKEIARTSKPVKVVDTESDQPDYKLKHKVHFTDLDTVVYRQPKTSKQEVLDYYYKISEHLLAYLKDRPVQVSRRSHRREESRELNAEMLFDGSERQTEWLHSATISKGKSKKDVLLCNDREHLLLCVEKGYVQFDPGTSKAKSIDAPDYFVIVVDGDESELSKTTTAATALKAILDGLQLPSFVKTDGRTALHIYVPLDGKSGMEASNGAAEFICKLARIKLPGLIVFHGVEEDVYGKVVLDYSINAIGKGIIAPYSLTGGEAATVATPLSWDEVQEGLRPEEFTRDTIMRRIKKSEAAFDPFYKKKVNANELLSRLEKNYAFLFD